MRFLHVGIDDTDSPDGMCTTYLACFIIKQLNENNISMYGYPNLIRLNPFARFKTRGNGAVCIKLAIPTENFDKKSKLAKEIIINNVKNLAMVDHENTNPGIVFYEGKVTEEMKNYSMKAIYSMISIKEAEDFANRIGAEIYKFKKGRGIIGSLAAIGCKLEDYGDYTYELISYRTKENYGKKRAIDKNSVIDMDKKTYPETFENLDGNYMAIEPRTPCPILYGIRGESLKALKIAKNIVKVHEPIESYCIFKTNQHTDMHLQKVAKISDMEKYGCYIVSGNVKKNPNVIEGGHIFFTLMDDSGEIEAAAYEPTKEFRKEVQKLTIGDQLQLFGGIGCGGTFNIEKLKILDLVKKTSYKNPICQCGKRMTSAGLNKGFKCKKCGSKLLDGEKIAIEEERGLVENGFYETPISARRHLAKPICRMKEELI